VARMSWQMGLVGFLGVMIGAVAVLGLAGRPAVSFNWPVPQIASQARPSVTVVLNYQKGHLKGMGTGVIVKAAGDIVTNYHVVAHATRVGVILSNGRRYTASVVGTDPPTDLAVVHIAHAGLLKPIRFAPPTPVVPGELAVAIGNSLGLTYSVTAGVISAPDRTVERDGQVYHLIQTDAAINPGNSGGPLLNTRGQLIGINSSKIAQTGVEGIGFAIPDSVIKEVIGQILKYGQVQRPWLGVAVDGARSGSAGLFVVRVEPKSPAAKAGLRPGDFIAKVNGHPMHTLTQWTDLIASSRIGQSLSLTLWRGSDQLAVSVRLSARPGSQAQAVSGT
jgi:serine protease Do